MTATGYGTASGTSMAAPHLGGAAALLLSAFPHLRRNVEATERILEQSAVPLTRPATCGGDSPTQVPNNVLRSVRFTRLSNASVDVQGGPANAAVNTDILLTSTQQPLVLTVRRTAAGPFTVHLMVTDRCGSWPTFVGGGANVP